MKPVFQTLLLCLSMVGGLAIAADTPVENDATQATKQVASDPNAPSTNPAYWLQQAARAYDAKDYAAVEEACKQLVELRPHIGEYGYLLAKAYALQSKRSQAYDQLLKLGGQGLTFDLDADPDLASLRNFPVYDYIKTTLEQNAGPSGDAQTAMTVEQQDLLIDGLDWDAEAKQFLVGSVREGKVSRLAADGSLTTLVQANADNGLLGVQDIAIDNERGWLWVASTGVPQFKKITREALGRTGIFKFDLKTGELIKRYLLVPDGLPHVLANLTVSPSGNLYVADAGSPMVYRITGKSDQLALYMVVPGLSGLRDLVVDPAERFLFVADYEQGLFRLDLASKKLYPFGAETSLNLGGIDGLTWYKDGLVAIQNGNEPARVMRIALDASGTRVGHAQPMLVGLESFSMPAVGAQVGRQLYLVAASEAHLYHPQSGQLLAGATLRAPVILKADMEQDWMTPPSVPAGKTDSLP